MFWTRVASGIMMATALACSGTSEPGSADSAGRSSYVPGRSYFGTSAYVEYIAGDLPLIVLAPHGGTIRASDMPDRANPDTLRDLGTEELARAIDSVVFVATTHHPHVIICRVHRVKLDCNRDRSVGAGTDPEAIRAWDEFQQFIALAKADVTRRFRRGLVVDMHGHGHTIQRLELGYLIDGAQLAFSEAVLDAPAWRDSISVREMLVRTNRSVSLALRGPQSLGTLLASRGYPSVPSESDPAPNGAPYFNGGFNTVTHGSIVAGTTSAIQIEANYTGVRDSAANRRRFAEAILGALRGYFSYWFDLTI